MSQLKYSLFILFVLFAFLGCNRGMEVTFIEGVVTLDGDPVSEAQVVFVTKSIGENGSVSSAFGSTDAEGHYTMTFQENSTYGINKGVPPGVYKVSVQKYIFGEGAPKTNQLPEIYANADTSGFEITVKEGKNEPFNFELSSEE